MEKIKFYIRELTIVTAGVLIALFLSNLIDKNQARKYQIASIETIKSEVEANHSDLKGVMETQASLLDTITKYGNDPIPISDLVSKASGINIATLRNTGLEFYTKNQINLIDFEMMSTLIRMNMLSELIDTKVEKVMDFVFPNLFIDSEESKILFSLHLRNVLESESQLLQIYENYLDGNMTTTPNTQ